MTRKTHPHGCLLTSVSIVTGIPETVLINLVGHDGSAIVGGYPVGFHIQEFQEVLYHRGFGFMPYETAPTSLLPNSEQHFLGYKVDFSQLLLSHETGILECYVTSSKQGHALVFRDGQLLDPDTGETFPAKLAELGRRGWALRCVWVLRTWV